MDRQPNKEVQIREVTQDTLDHFSLISDNFAEIAAKKPTDNISGRSILTRSLRELSTALNPENLHIDTSIIRKRKVRTDDQADVIAAQRGEDPGVRLQVALQDGSEVNVNIKGGMRQGSELDKRQGAGAARRGETSTDLTHTALSKPTEININILSQGTVIFNVWFRISPVLTPQENKSTALITFQGNVLHGRKYDDLLPLIENEPYNVDGLRKLISRLIELRSNE